MYISKKVLASIVAIGVTLGLSKAPAFAATKGISRSKTPAFAATKGISRSKTPVSKSLFTSPSSLCFQPRVFGVAARDYWSESKYTSKGVRYFTDSITKTTVNGQVQYSYAMSSNSWDNINYTQDSNTPTVAIIQYKLGISVDGIYGSETVNAVKSFQTQHSLGADGIVGQGTWNAIFGIGTSTGSNTSAPTNTSNPTQSTSPSTGTNITYVTPTIGTPTVFGTAPNEIWSENEANYSASIKKTTINGEVTYSYTMSSTAWNNINYTIGSNSPTVAIIQYKLGIGVDGVYGTQTANAVKSFQLAHNLGSDGVVGPNTWRAIFS